MRELRSLAFERLRRDPGLALLLGALVAAVALYLPTLGRGLVDYDDGWMLRDNWIVQHPSWSSLKTILFDLESPRRYVLAPEYLPVRDLSVMLDFAIWGDWYPGHHVTNLALYLAAIALWFAALSELGIDRKIAGLAMLVWAIHPSHAESVAWLAERKGLLGAAFAGAAALGYARFRGGGKVPWLALATIAAIAAVWSKALAAFAIAGFAGLEFALPMRRVSWIRSLSALGVIAVAAGAAFVPVIILASRAAVVGTGLALPGGRLATVLGVHGFYIELFAMVVPNAIAYPIASHGPTAIQIAVGAVVLAAIVAVAVVPRRGAWAPPPALRAGALLWLFGWIPASHLVLPLQMVIVADRYALLPSLGLALAVAVGITHVPRPRLAVALTAVICVAAGVRTLDAQGRWSDPRALWGRAVDSDPDDPSAGSMYAQALGLERPDLAAQAVARGLARQPTPRLLISQALLELERGDRVNAIAHMQKAAEGGDPRAMANLALMLVDNGELDDGKLKEALAWARRAVDADRYAAYAYRALGTVALLARQPEQALAAFERALAAEPPNLGNRFNLALALLALDRYAEASLHLAACLADPALGARARTLLDRGR